MFEWITGLGFRIADLGLRIWDFCFDAGQNKYPVVLNSRSATFTMG
jgi:hypothetical protein